MGSIVAAHELCGAVSVVVAHRLSGPGITPKSPASAGQFLTIEPPGKS